MYAKKSVEIEQGGSSDESSPNRNSDSNIGSRAGLRVAASNPAPVKTKTATDLSRQLLLDRQALALRLIAEFLDQSSFSASLAALAGECQHRFRCDRVVIGLFSAEEMKVEAISQQSKIDRLSGEVQLLTAALQEACDQDRMIQFPASERNLTITLAHKNLSIGRQSVQFCTIPLCHQERHIGAVLFELESSQGWSPFTVQLMQQIADLAGPLIDIRRQSERGISDLAKERVVNFGISVLKPDYLLTKFVLAASVLLIAAAYVTPVPFRINSIAEVVPIERRMVTAPVRGYLEQINAKNGDSVVAGETLAKLETRDLKLEQVNRENEISAARSELRAAMASHNRKDMAIAQARLDQAQAQLDLINQQIIRSTLVAPVDGTIVNGDLTQSLGAPVERGDTLFEIVPSQGYKAYLLVAEADVRHVTVAQPGQLILKSDPGEALPISVKNIHPVAVGSNGVNRFRVEVDFSSDNEGIRPGQTGIAKLEVGKRSLLWTASHRFVNWWRMQLWEWVG